MKEQVIISIITISALIAFTFLMFFLMRMFSNATTPINVFSPVEGVQCVKLVTADGVAVDCWKE